MVLLIAKKSGKLQLTWQTASQPATARWDRTDRTTQTERRANWFLVLMIVSDTRHYTIYFYYTYTLKNISLTCPVHQRLYIYIYSIQHAFNYRRAESQTRFNRTPRCVACASFFGVRCINVFSIFSGFTDGSLSLPLCYSAWSGFDDSCVK